MDEFKQRFERFLYFISVTLWIDYLIFSVIAVLSYHSEARHMAFRWYSKKYLIFLALFFFSQSLMAISLLRPKRILRGFLAPGVIGLLLLGPLAYYFVYIHNFYVVHLEAVKKLFLVSVFYLFVSSRWGGGFFYTSLNKIRASTHEILEMPARRFLKLIAFNLLMAGFLFVILELITRLLIPEPSIYKIPHPMPGQYSKFQPYVMHTNEGPLDHNAIWIDPINKKKIPFHVKSNALGFRMKRELDVSTMYRKKPDEKVVLIFGGSAVYGFGNTSNDTTIAGYMQKFLNRKQNRYHYTVFNVGNGGWVSFQEYLGFVLYGLNLDPDWVVVMDGRNDIFTVFTPSSESVGAPFSSAQIRLNVDGLCYHHPQPDLLRGKIENWIVKHSRLYRIITRKKPFQPPPIPSMRHFDYMDKTIAFYIQTQKQFLNACPECQFILSTQPVYRSGRDLYTSEKQLQAVAKKYKNTNLFDPANMEDFLMYGMTNIVNKTQSLCGQHPENCRYYNIDDLFPRNDRLKMHYFVDDVHLNDQGNAKIAAFYTDRILAVTAK